MRTVSEMPQPMRLRWELLTRGISSKRLTECIGGEYPHLRRTEATVSRYLNGLIPMPEEWLRAAVELLGIPAEDLGITAKELGTEAAEVSR